MILGEISDATTTAVFQSAGSVMAMTTVVMAQMRGTVVSILLNILPHSPSSESRVHQGYRTWLIYFLALYYKYYKNLKMYS